MKWRKSAFIVFARHAVLDRVYFVENSAGMTFMAESCE